MVYCYKKLNLVQCHVYLLLINTNKIYNYCTAHPKLKNHILIPLESSFPTSLHPASACIKLTSFIGIFLHAHSTCSPSLIYLNTCKILNPSPILIAPSTTWPRISPNYMLCACGQGVGVLVAMLCNTD